MTITITAFERSLDGGKGLARDTRVRWALEEVGQPYEVRLVSFRAMKEPARLTLHPFGQIPTYDIEAAADFPFQNFKNRLVVPPDEHQPLFVLRHNQKTPLPARGFIALFRNQVILCRQSAPMKRRVS